MPPAPVSYRFTDSAAACRTLEEVARRFSSHRHAISTRSTTYYDTFDWRIFRAGEMLFTQLDGRCRILHWTRPDGTLRHRAAISERPGFAWDLPTGPLREGLEPVVEMRRLLPIVAIEARAETLGILDRREKTVARVRLEESRVHPLRGNRPSSELPVVVQALAVRGYDRQFEALLGVIEEVGPERLEESEYSRAAVAAGLQPGAYSRKLDLRLDPAMRSDEAVKVVLRRLAQIMRQNEDGLREDLDSEFVHDFRVSVRRTRSALTQLKGVFPPDLVKPFKTEFSWLGQITGPTRDLDVYRLKMPEYRDSLPEHVRADLDPLSDFLDRHQVIEHQELVQLLTTERYRSLVATWQDFLDQPVPEKSDLPSATAPILQLASERIWSAYRKVLKKGDAIQPDTPAKALHRLRIECKKLRYLLEFFRSLCDPREIETLIAALKRLQDNLGDFNDLEVQQATLQQFAQTMIAEKLGTGRTLMAMGRLVERLEQRQAQERRAFHRRFAKFSSRKNRQRFERLFAPSDKAGA